LAEKLGKAAFWCMFVGFNVAFFPLHFAGLAGMPRRVWTYSEELGVGSLNLVSTAGAYLLAIGIGIFLVDLMLNFRLGKARQRNPWGAGTLEWLPGDVYSTRSIPHITSREPLWDRPELAREVEDGLHYLPDAPTGGRETIITSPIEARPQYVVRMPGPSWTHVVAAILTAACFLLLTIKAVVPAVACGIGAVGACLAWVWQIDRGPGPEEIEIGHGIRLPTYMTGPTGHGWWAMAILMLVAASLFIAYLFSYLYLWTVSPGAWPLESELVPLRWSAIVLASFAGVLVCFAHAFTCLQRGQRTARYVPWLVAIGALLLVLGIASETYGYWSSGLRPTDSSYGAIVYVAAVLNGQLAAAIVVMSAFTVARHYFGKLDRVRCASLENTLLLVYYTVGQAIVSLVLIHGFPRLVG